MLAALFCGSGRFAFKVFTPSSSSSPHHTILIISSQVGIFVESFLLLVFLM
jgi:hypothetical protein